MHIYSVFEEGAKSTQRGKDSLYNKWCWENWIAICKRIIQKSLLSHTIYKNKLKMDSELKCKIWNHKTLRRKHTQYTLDITLSSIFLDQSPLTRVTKVKINQFFEFKNSQPLFHSIFPYTIKYWTYSISSDNVFNSLLEMWF